MIFNMELEPIGELIHASGIAISDLFNRRLIELIDKFMSMTGSEYIYS